jgi:hypothetical protein
MSDKMPYNLENLIVGAVRVMWALVEDIATVPVKIQDIVFMTAAGAYAAKTDWNEFGATSDASAYTRGMESEGVEIQQETGQIMKEITEINRAFSLTMAEIFEDNVQILENADAIEDVAAAALTGAQKSIGLGTFTDLTEYRMAFLSFRKKQAGIVNEPGGIKRGRMNMLILNRATLTAEDAEVEWEKGNLTDVEVGFEGYPEPDEEDNVAYGRWLFEQAGTIAGA